MAVPGRQNIRLITDNAASTTRLRARLRPGKPLLGYALVCALFAADAGLYLSKTDASPFDAATSAGLPADVLNLTARGMHVCAGTARRDCVVDGDTFWIAGEKIRIANINAPEMNGGCVRERKLARDARDRLAVILSGNAISMQRSGYDKFGRTLALVSAEGSDVGKNIIAAGLAEQWGGARIDWCGM